MAEVIFNYEGMITTIQCEINQKMNEIIDKFLIKSENKDKNLFYLYNGNQINNGLTFEEQANEIDKKRNKMNIVVNTTDEEMDELKEIASKEIICPNCKENALLDINNFKINLYGCKNNHNIKDILLYKYDETQKINISNIKCNICNKNNKGNTRDNLFYICSTCNKNICPLCKSVHDKEHIIINYDDKNYICSQHKEPFNKFCETCKKNICLICESNHSGHSFLELGALLTDEKDLLKIQGDLKNVIDKFKDKINYIYEIFNKMIDLLNIFYNINNNIIKDYNKNKRNYYILKNLNYLKNNNENLIKKLKDLINNDNLSGLFEYTVNNFYNDDGKKYIGEIKNGLKEGKGLLYYEKNNEFDRKKYEGNFKNDKPEGKGTMYWNNGSWYDGDWVNGSKEGKGIYLYPNGDRYEGDFKHGINEGKGIMYWKSGLKYEGDWKNGIKEGKGIMYYIDGSRYEGDFQKEMIEGKGVMYYKNGDRYEGDFKNNKKEGKGTLYLSNGKVKQGNWKNDKYKGK